MVDIQCPSRGVILFDSRLGRSPYMWVNNILVTVMYWQPISGHMPKLNLAQFRARCENGSLILGGYDQLVWARNAAIGRRLCPVCYEEGIKAPVKEREDIGRCSRCSQTVDYILSTYQPYFFYFSHQKNEDTLHIQHGSPEYKLAELLKTAMIDQEVRDLMLPAHAVNDGGDYMVDMFIPSYLKPLVFDIRQTPVHGTFGKTVYDFRPEQ